MTGIDFTQSNFQQLRQIQGSSFAPVFAESNDWLPGAVSATVASVGSMTATASNTAINSSLSVFSTRHPSSWGPFVTLLLPR